VETGSLLNAIVMQKYIHTWMIWTLKQCNIFSTKSKEPKQLKAWFIADVSRNNLSHCQSE